MVSWNRGGYAVPGVETKLSARLSAGESSNLMCGVGSIVKVYIGDGFVCLLIFVAWNVVDWEITRTSRIAVTQYMYAVEWPILNLTLWPSGLDDSGTEEGNSHVPGTQSTAEGVFVCSGC